MIAGAIALLTLAIASHTITWKAASRRARRQLLIELCIANCIREFPRITSEFQIADYVNDNLETTDVKREDITRCISRLMKDGLLDQNIQGEYRILPAQTK